MPPFPPVPGGPGAPKKPRPAWLIPALIGGGAVLLVIVLIAGIAIVKSVGGGGDTGSPGATVKAYFAALQAGDAKKALSYGKEAPASTELLTDDVLRKQRELAPIKDLKIVSETDGYMGSVHLTVTIGAVSTATEAWTLGDIGVGLMAWLNIIGILVLQNAAFTALRDFERQQKMGIDPQFDPTPLGIVNATFWEERAASRRADPVDA